VTIYNVSGAAGLQAALASARGGETIRLATGNYGNFRMGDFAPNLTIEAAPDANVQFSRLAMWRTEDLTIRNITIGSGRGPGEPVWVRQAEFFQVKGLLVDGVKMHGSLDNNPQNDSWGLFVRDSSGITVQNSEFTELSRGAMFERSQDIQVKKNLFHKLETDGANFSGVRNVFIEENHFTDFYPFYESHPDAIQFWTNGQKISNENIAIRGNVLLQGNGVSPQGIFLGEENGNLPYKNVRIENNLMYGSDHWHGIAVYNARNLDIIGNSTLSPTTDAKRFWIHVAKSDEVLLSRNVTDQLLLSPDNRNVTLKDNVDLLATPSARSLVDLDRGAAAKIADLVMEGVGYQATSTAPVPGPAAPPPSAPPPPAADGPIYGTPGRDTINGAAGDDRIFGVGRYEAAPGRGTVDQLWGRGGADTFVLGDQRGLFYDDGRKGTSGRSDFARINDFRAVEGDRIQLVGDHDDYVFRATKSGTGPVLEIFRDTDGDRRWDSGDELIAQLANVKDLAIDAFVFA
jgi:Ca2+-binding RTX toxin-like protein